MSKIVWIIVAIAVGAGVVGYLWYGGATIRQPDQGYGKTQQEGAVSADGAEVENELKAIQTDGLDAELRDIEKEIAK